jgi:hypothetical protein
LGLLVALPAAATVVIAQSYEEMARTSPVIVRAWVGQVQSAWNEGHTTIETYAEIRVTEVLKGKLKPGTILMIRNPGGVVGKVGARVEGTPAFQPGEEALLFLEPATDVANIWLVSGLAAGKITFAKSPLGGDLRAVRDVRGLAFYDRSAGAPKYQKVSRPEDLGSADAFITRVRKAVSR